MSPRRIMARVEWTPKSKWLATCKCGWRGRPVDERYEAERQRTIHRREHNA